MTNKYIMVIVMCATKAQAKKIAMSLLKKRLIACANISSGVNSMFWWKRKIDSAKETMLTMKTLAAKFAGIESEVRRMHSYEVPEIIALPVTAGSRKYLRWIDQSVAHP
jgi:periplasmic divalent cation tolerance protein